MRRGRRANGRRASSRHSQAAPSGAQGSNSATTGKRKRVTAKKTNAVTVHSSAHSPSSAFSGSGGATASPINPASTMIM